MSLLTTQEIYEIACNGNEGSCFGDLGWQDCTEGFARAVEAAILAKLTSAELPEPALSRRKDHEYFDQYEYREGNSDPMFWEQFYTADHLRQAFAQGAASQLSAEPIYQYQMGDGSWIDQQRHSYYYNRLHAPNAVVRIVFTLKEPK